MTKVFFGGVPTTSDVQLLLDAFPNIEPGQVILYTEVALVIRVQHGSARFKSVTDAWRRHLTRTLNYVLEAVPGRGFRRRTELERSQENRAGWRRDQARAARKVRDLARTDTRDFSAREQASHDHARRVLQAHVEHTASSVRQLAPPASQAQLPKVGEAAAGKP